MLSRSHAFDTFQGKSHALRASLSREMHARKLPRFVAPARLLQIVMLVNEREAEEAVRHLDELIDPHGGDPDFDLRYHSCRIGDIGFAWERHTEFTTYTFIAEAIDEALFDFGDFAHLADWINELPGEIVRASQIRLLDADQPLPSDAALAENFSSDDLIICDVAEGRARIWTDFRLHSDGFGRLLIADRGLVGSEPHQLVQRLQDLGNYRKMALLGLPVAQRMMPEITRLEQRLAVLARAIAHGESDDDGALAEISFLSAELARIMAETRYRMSATQAYAELCMDRIRRLSVQRVAGFRSLADFTERRLLPAMRTCDAFSQRLDDLSQRAGWTSALLRTRIDTELAKQNRDLLASMNRRTKLQLRLQQTVEGLSVAAITYYLVGLVGYVLKAAHQVAPVINSELWTACTVPLILATVWLALRKLRRNLI